MDPMGVRARYRDREIDIKIHIDIHKEIYCKELAHMMGLNPKFVRLAVRLKYRYC
jgi:hypothetical protein